MILDIRPTASPLGIPTQSIPPTAPERGVLVKVVIPVIAPDIAPASPANNGPKRIPRRQLLSRMNHKYNLDTRKHDRKPVMIATRKLMNSPESWGYCHKIRPYKPAIRAPTPPTIKLAIVILFLGITFPDP